MEAGALARPGGEAAVSSEEARCARRAGETPASTGCAQITRRGGSRRPLHSPDRNQILCSRSEDFREGITAFLTKRPAVYREQ